MNEPEKKSSENITKNEVLGAMDDIESFLKNITKRIVIIAEGGLEDLTSKIWGRCKENIKQNIDKGE